jgi:hypothetical protein
LVESGKRLLEDLAIDGRIILKLIFGKYVESLDWIYLARIATGDGLL